jgi:hypothetical protein
MQDRPFLSSLTRISPLSQRPFTVGEIDRGLWATGDYIVCEVEEASGFTHLELDTGRLTNLVVGDRIIAVPGKRMATLEWTGDWEAVGPDGKMNMLTGAGLVGRVISRSPFLPAAMKLRYCGHVMLGGHKATMRRFVPEVEPRDFLIPTVLLIGTSMSCGKTTAARTIVRLLAGKGKRVLAAKVTGAGRYRDIQTVGDSGAEWIYDFVDAGIPSTVMPEGEYREAISGLLSRMAADPADVAVIEIGASPLEPYNGMAAIDLLSEALRCTALAASDAYAASGLMSSTNIRPDLICGPAANTQAGIALTENLCGVTALNLSDPASYGALGRILSERFKTSHA